MRYTLGTKLVAFCAPPPMWYQVISLALFVVVFGWRGSEKRAEGVYGESEAITKNIIYSLRS